MHRRNPAEEVKFDLGPNILVGFRQVGKRARGVSSPEMLTCMAGSRPIHGAGDPTEGEV